MKTFQSYFHYEKFCIYIKNLEINLFNYSKKNHLIKTNTFEKECYFSF